MIDYHNNIVSALLKVGIPVHYEMTLKSGLETPCYSYLELTNSVQLQTDISDVSVVSYQISVWDTDMKNIQKYSIEADKVMRALNFQRAGSAELYDNKSTMIHKVLTYEALASEKFE